MVLRHFLYLDENLVSDFYEELIETDKDFSVKKKFSKLYDEITNLNEITMLNENGISFSEIKSHSIVETTGIVKIPEQFLNLITLNTFMDSNLFGFAESLGIASYSETETIEKQGEQIRNLTRDNSTVPLILPAKDINPIKILTNLNKKFLKTDIQDIDEKNVFIIGKVIKKIEQRKKHKLYTMLPNVPENREQRRRKKDDSIKNIQVEENGPALLILPIAIYQ